MSQKGDKNQKSGDKGKDSQSSDQKADKNMEKYHRDIRDVHGRDNRMTLMGHSLAHTAYRLNKDDGQKTAADAERISMLLEPFGFFWILLDSFGFFWILFDYSNIQFKYSLLIETFFECFIILSNKTENILKNMNDSDQQSSSGKNKKDKR